MRKRHQAILISSNAKRNICNEISLNYDSYEIEQKYLLNNYFKENINPEDIVPSNIKETSPENVDEEGEEENEDLEDSSDSEEEIISINSNIKVPPQGEDKGPYIKYEISEKAFIGGINHNDYIIIPENKIKIKSENNNNINNIYKNKKQNDSDETQDYRTIKIGQKIDFNDILEQIAYWSEQINLENAKDKIKNKKKIKDVEIPDINILQMFKLYPKKLDEMNEKIKTIQKEIRDKNLNNDNCILNKLVNEQENIVNKKKENINKLSMDFDKIKTITYGNNFSLIEFK